MIDPLLTGPAAVAAVFGLCEKLYDRVTTRKKTEKLQDDQDDKGESDRLYIEAVSKLRKLLRESPGTTLTPNDPDSPYWLYFMRRATADGFLDLMGDSTLVLPQNGLRPPQKPWALG